MMIPASPVQQACLIRLEAEREALREFRASGGKVMGYLCQAFPPAVAAGLGFWPVRVLEDASTELEDAGGAVIRPDVCPLIKVLLGSAGTGSLACSVDTWAGLATCDQTRRCFSILPEVLETVVHGMQLPSTRTAEAEERYSASMEDFCRQVVAAGHSKGYDEGRAKSFALAMHQAGETLADAVTSGSLSPLDIHWMLHLFHTTRPHGLADFFREIIAVSGGYPHSRTVAVAGSSIPFNDTILLQSLQDAGVSVLPLYCSGLQALPYRGLNRPTESYDPGSLAAEAFRSVRCARSRPNDGMFDYVESSVRESRAAGLIVRTMKFCDLWFTERVRFREKSSVPVLVMDVSFSTGEAERQVNRIEAFLETLALA
jgi:benzoyl-CoA reductase/2-hydroxyglutaryl-CoA dehydratase subunit BcrC/BadD/HgdB